MDSGICCNFPAGRCRTLCGVLALGGVSQFNYDLENGLKDEERVAFPRSWEEKEP